MRLKNAGEVLVRSRAPEASKIFWLISRMSNSVFECVASSKDYERATRSPKEGSGYLQSIDQSLQSRTPRNGLQLFLQQSQEGFRSRRALSPLAKKSDDIRRWQAIAR